MELSFKAISNQQISFIVLCSSRHTMLSRETLQACITFSYQGNWSNLFSAHDMTCSNLKNEIKNPSLYAYSSVRTTAQSAVFFNSLMNRTMRVFLVHCQIILIKGEISKSQLYDKGVYPICNGPFVFLRMDEVKIYIVQKTSTSSYTTFESQTIENSTSCLHRHAGGKKA